ncbi:1-acyl-sn-glycerol-3-phosphate acyltransferase [Methylococcus sp. EFPC2]|uniref:lysophospholipid acyltransferase family protein n=1 Tax=Methylococcus sp. EFPC2 TaxID=2812648 RepID=UPI0019671C17|nr:lysophospholipid acyltransferase family protein [Methylococcus sp. EFPC2]QSA97461.1 1-acyl-sn-glycerol-3-phosphate acyltransferase [Methylococcus sp. EFPC2]
MKPLNTSSTPKADGLVAIRSAVFFLGMTIATLVVAPLILLAKPFAFATRYRIAQGWVKFNLWSLKTVCGLSHTVEGRENIPDRCAVILSKHQSAWETIALQAIFPPMAFILKRELLKIPFWGWAMAALEPIAIDRAAKTAALKQVLRDGEARLQAGRWVVIFPEGTRVAPGKRGRYNASGGLLASRVGCPVVPVAHNAGEFWRRNAFMKFPGVIKVSIGPAIDAAQLSAAEVNKLAEDWIEAKMAEISSVGTEAAASHEVE